MSSGSSLDNIARKLETAETEFIIKCNKLATKNANIMHQEAVTEAGVDCQVIPSGDNSCL